ncbi:calcineurin-like phosphoesterase domain-containing protein [Ditylenchus destructor]|nr:calcineurin-like phosphoesterase domain-containing protein [Ditylenchus destructor]
MIGLKTAIRRCLRLLNWFKGKSILLVLSPILVLVFNEYLIFYLALFRCNWPSLNATDNKNSFNATNVLILADTHLLGIYRGNRFDKLKREWQMHRSFQTAISMFNPEAVFFLGDLLDEGLLGLDSLFNTYVEQFDALFYTPEKTKRFYVAGNHDIGFHHEIYPMRLNRFSRSFGVPPAVQQIELNGNIIILLNSMAMEGDGCRLCGEAEREIERIGRLLNCTRNFAEDCKGKLQIPYSRPIIMQHFPLFRRSDEVDCEETADMAPTNILSQKFRPRFDCLSKDSTKYLLDMLRPRAVFGGHTHYGCRKWWRSPANLWEYTVPSLSWRNNRRPSFLLVSLSPSELKVESCFLPDEYYVIASYVVFLVIWLTAVLFNCISLCKRMKRSKVCKKLTPSLSNGGKVNIE